MSSEQETPSTVNVELQDGSITSLEYSAHCSIRDLVKNIFKREQQDSNFQLSSIHLFEVCQQGLTRCIRPYELVKDVVATWGPRHSNFLQVKTGSCMPHCDPSLNRIMSVNVRFSVLDQDWMKGTVDIFDGMFYLRSLDYNGVWRAADLSELDSYGLPGSPGVVVLRSQLDIEQLPDRTDRFLAMHMPASTAEIVRNLVYWVRTQALLFPGTSHFHASPVIGPPPTLTLRAPRNRDALITPPLSPSASQTSQPSPNKSQIPPPVPPKDPVTRKKRRSGRKRVVEPLDESVASFHPNMFADPRKIRAGAFI